MFLLTEGGNFNISSLEAEEDNAVIVDIEPPKPKRRKIATLKVPLIHYMIFFLRYCTIIVLTVNILNKFPLH